jgi:hypothetical protein
MNPASRVLIVLVLAGLTNGNANATLITISGTGQFDSSLGTLNSVTVRFNSASGSTSSVSSTSHTINPATLSIVGSFNNETFAPLAAGTIVDFAPVVLESAGPHSHSVNFPSFAWNGVARDYFGDTVSNPSGGHGHTPVNFGSAPVTVTGVNSFINLPSATTNFAGGHLHNVLIPSLSHQFTGAEMTAWLVGNPTPVMTIPSFSTGNEPAHSHEWDVFDTSFAATIGGTPGFIRFLGNPTIESSESGSHSHNAAMTLFALDTTFDYTPFPVITSTPEPTSMALLGVTGIGGISLRSRQRRKALKVQTAA